MWKPIAVLAAAGSVSAHLIVLSGYSSPEEGASSSTLLSNPEQILQMEGSDKKTILIGLQSESEDGPAVKMARNTFFRFPDGTRIVSKTATDSLMIVDLAIPMGQAALVDEFRAAVNSVPYSFKLPKGQVGSVKIEFWSDEGSGQIVLDEISDKKTSASIRIYGQGLFSRT